jgi:hypothetical protein
MRANQDRPALGPGFLLVSVGAGLLARELGLLSPHVRVLDFWPLFVVMIGISVLVRNGGIVSAIFALAFIATGGVLLAGNLGFLTSSATRFWPLLLVLLGLRALLRGGRGPGPERGDSDLQPPLGADRLSRDDWASDDPDLDRPTDEHRLSRHYTCAGAQLRVESQAWRGGELGVTAGGVELDLRQARLDPEGAVLVLNVLMGGVEIRVPDTWQVHCDVVPLFGGVDDSTRSTQGASAAPRLRIVGKVTLGGVNVQN